ncbi:MAG: hypothetical protein LBL58_19235 [Tannerellaceae bacterium]|jgi:hypothetical protein|nr:hypothetical protein [Tannerellaceae bacterium]
MEVKQIYDNLIQILRLIASTPNVQIASFPQFVNVADEIALSYNDIYLLVPLLKKEGLISPVVYGILTQMDELFDIMSQNKSIWNVDALENDKYWQKSRFLALSILKELNESYDKPNLGFVNWIT